MAPFEELPSFSKAIVSSRYLDFHVVSFHLFTLLPVSLYLNEVSYRQHIVGSWWCLGFGFNLLYQSLPFNWHVQSVHLQYSYWYVSLNVIVLSVLLIPSFFYFLVLYSCVLLVHLLNFILVHLCLDISAVTLDITFYKHNFSIYWCWHFTSLGLKTTSFKSLSPHLFTVILNTSQHILRIPSDNFIISASTVKHKSGNSKWKVLCVPPVALFFFCFDVPRFVLFFLFPLCKMCFSLLSRFFVFSFQNFEYDMSYADFLGLFLFEDCSSSWVCKFISLPSLEGVFILMLHTLVYIYVYMHFLYDPYSWYLGYFISERFWFFQSFLSSVNRYFTFSF